MLTRHLLTVLTCDTFEGGKIFISVANFSQLWRIPCLSIVRPRSLGYTNVSVSWFVCQSA